MNFILHSIVMLTAKDEKKMRGLMSEILRDALILNNEVFGSQLKREIRDEMHALISASESKVIRHLESKIESVKEGIIDGIIDTLDRDIYPRLDGHDRDIAQLKIAARIA